MAKRKKAEPTDGFGPRERAKVRSAVRLVWHRCHARRLAQKRAIGPDGFLVCESCQKKSPKLAVDHIHPVGEVDEGFLERMFVPSRKLQNLCPPCHRKKTNAQRKKRR